MELNEITGKIIGCAMKVHSELGPGLLESCYRECMFYETNKEGLFVEKEKPIPIIYKQIKLNADFRADLIVEKSVLTELKSVDVLHDIHTAQILTYLKLSGIKIGLLLNFNVLHLKDGIRRFKM